MSLESIKQVMDYIIFILAFVLLIVTCPLWKMIGSACRNKGDKQCHGKTKSN